LADEGVKLVTLLGQAVNKYKYTAGEKTYTLADLLYKVSDIQGIEWIRFVTSYPQKEGFAELMQAMADLPKVCNYLHMPVQSGSDKILKAMNRCCTARQYLGLLDTARQIVPDIAIASDFIVGFPDESDENFERTVDLVKNAQYKNCFVFKYSPRPGTAADEKLLDNIPAEVKKHRNYKLLEVQENISAKLSAGFEGKQVNVLVEGLSKKPHLNRADNSGNPQLVGRTADDWIVVFNGPVSLAGQFAKVKITKTSPLTLFGELI
jgi:tRNA-2-methylthio-N6-dimethylallyladenosine synthase